MTKVEQLLEYCQWLTKTMAYDNEVGAYYWPHVGIIKEPEDLCECGICTNAAILIAKKFNGYVVGYPVNMNFKFVGHTAGGHDFAVIGDIIVDWWGWQYEKSLDSPIVIPPDNRFKPANEWHLNKRHNYANLYSPNASCLSAAS